MRDFKKIPILDLSPLKSDPGSREIARQIQDALFQVGFFYVIHHGVSSEMLTYVFEAARAFHGLPEEKKLPLLQNKFFRGYVPLNSSRHTASNLNRNLTPDCMAALVIGHEVSEEDVDYKLERNYAGPNQWPEDLPEFKLNVMNYYREALGLFQRLLQSISIGFGMNPKDLDSFFLNPFVFFRLNFYPKQCSSDQFGMAPHLDNQFLTILAQDDQAGLQIRNDLNEWIDAPPMPGALIVNTGDTVRYFTNDVLKPTPHRVVNCSQKDRYSIPLFIDPNMHSVIGPLPPFCSDEVSIKYPHAEYCEFSRQRRIAYDKQSD